MNAPANKKTICKKLNSVISLWPVTLALFVLTVFLSWLLLSRISTISTYSSAYLRYSAYVSSLNINNADSAELAITNISQIQLLGDQTSFLRGYRRSDSNESTQSISGETTANEGWP